MQEFHPAETEAAGRRSRRAVAWPKLELGEPYIFRLVGRGASTDLECFPGLDSAHELLLE